MPNKSKKKGKKKARGEWDSDDEDDSDGPTYPAGIMKVCPLFITNTARTNTSRLGSAQT
jgi:hypothetical protein